MEEKNKEKWIGGILDSIEGIERATPPESLFSKIEQQFKVGEARVITMRQWNIAAAIAVLVVFMNVITFRQLTQSSTVYAQNSISEELADQLLISNYYIYE